MTDEQLTLSSDPSAPRISLVVPAHDEERYLPDLLDTVDRARSRYAQGPGAVEVIVSDNASTDRTAEIAALRGCRVVYVAKRAIAAARNGGARIARGEVLTFVDADTRIRPETFNAIDAAIASDRVVGGATGVRLDRMSLGIACTHVLLIPMVWVTGFDTGVVFLRRADFEAIGGYDESIRWGEDVRLMVAMWRLGRSRGQRLVRLRPVKAIASARKFDEHGDWHYFALVARAIPWLFGNRGPADRIADRYWYGDRRR